jgi:hypothetical protein
MRLVFIGIARFADANAEADADADADADAEAEEAPEIFAIKSFVANCLHV